jgi:DNA-binding NarL/FixJ family response regulator
MAPDMRTVVLVDDDGRFRSVAARALAAEELEVVAEAANACAAMEAVSTWGPDLVLVDIGLPDVDGAEVARRLRRAGCQATLILISSRDAEYGRRVAHGVADGFIPKDQLSRATIDAIGDRPSC